MNFTFSTRQTTDVKEMKPWQSILFGLIFVVVGAIILFIAVNTIKTYNKKNETFIETTSRVVSYNSNDEGLQAIVVEYTVDGQTYTKDSNSYSNMPKALGTEVSIKYNPEDPKDAIWTTDSTNIVLPLAGGLFVVVGIILVIFGIKNSKKQPKLDGQSDEQNGMLNNEQSQMSYQNQQVVSNGMNNLNQPMPSYNQNQQVVSNSMNNLNQPMPSYNQNQQVVSNSMNNLNQQNNNPNINNSLGN